MCVRIIHGANKHLVFHVEHDTCQTRNEHGGDAVEGQKLAYPIEVAFSLIGASRTRGYQLIASGDLDTYKDGKRRYATHAALEACLEKLRSRSEGRAAA